MRIGLTLFRIPDPNNWHLRVRDALRSNEYRFHRRGEAMLAWFPKRGRQAADGDIAVYDGFEIRRHWIEPRKYGLAITSRRLYFESAGAVHPANRPRHELELLDEPRTPSAESRLVECLELGKVLGTSTSACSPVAVNVVSLNTGPQPKMRLEMGCGVLIGLNDNLPTALCKHGFAEVSKGFEVSMYAKEPNRSEVRRYAIELQLAMERTGINGKATIRRISELIPDAIGRSQAVLIATTGRKGDPIPGEVARAMDLLDQTGIRYRLFSVDNSAMRWSALDQLVSLVQCGGGVPYRLRLPSNEGNGVDYFFGVDVGHPIGTDYSWLAMSLLDKHGLHVGSWRARQPRDETARIQILKAGIAWANEVLRRRDHPDARLLILRDGRLNSGESPQSYQNLGGARTFVELAKSGNPEMFVRHGDKLQPANGGMSCQVEDSETRYVVTAGARLENQLPRVFKVRMQANEDELGIGLNAVVALLVGLAHSPALGLAPHALPGPIYWADGVAGISPRNCQFRGQDIITRA